MTYGKGARVAGLLVVVAAILAAVGYRLSASSPAASPTDGRRVWPSHGQAAYFIAGALASRSGRTSILVRSPASRR